MIKIAIFHPRSVLVICVPMAGVALIFIPEFRCVLFEGYISGLAW